MRKTFIFLIIIITNYSLYYAQVGINTTTPTTTLEIVGKNKDITSSDGVIIPKISKNDLANKNPTTYNDSHIGTLVYVTDIATPTGTQPSLSQVVNINSLGFYYFDENKIWQKLIISANADTSKDAWIDNSSSSRIELGTTSTGASRSTGTEVVINDAGNMGIGINVPTNKLHVSGTSNPVKIEGLVADTAAPNIMVVDSNGVLKTIPKTNITTTTVSNTSNVNQLTTTVNGVTGDAVNIINSNTLTKPATNTLRSTVNAVASTPDINIISAVSNTASNSNNTISTTVNGITGTAVTVPNIYTTDGTLTGNRTVTQNANTLAFTGSSSNAFSVDGTTFSVDASNDNVGIGTSSPNANAKIEISATNKGLLLPRVTLTATGNASPLSAHVAGMEVYNTATNTGTSGQEVYPGKYINDGSKWMRQITVDDTRVVMGANSTDFIPSTLITVGAATDAALDLSQPYTFTLDKPSYVEFRGNISVALEDNFGNPILDGRTRMCIAYWQFTALPATATASGYVSTGQYARSTINYSAYYTGSTTSTTHTSGNFFLNPSATYLLPIGTYSVKLTSIAVSMGVSYRARWGAAGYDTASIIIRSAR